MKQSRFADEQIIGFLKQADAGMSAKVFGAFEGLHRYLNFLYGLEIFI